MQRPMFSEKLSVSEFQKYYWYKSFYSPTIVL